MPPSLILKREEHSIGLEFLPFEKREIREIFFFHNFPKDSIFVQKSQIVMVIYAYTLSC